MAEPKFNVRISDYASLDRIEGAWTVDDYKTLLSSMEFDPEGSGAVEELHELCLMCLQDRDKQEAAQIVVRHRLAGKLSDGQIRNESAELADEKLWEQYPDLSLHEEFFHVGSLLYQARPQDFYQPDAVKLVVEIEAVNEASKEILAQPTVESFLVRLLADGMKEGAILNRLFDDQLASDPFPEASSIIWIVNSIAQAGKTSTVEVISSAHWLDALKGVESFESGAQPDAARVAE